MSYFEAADHDLHAFVDGRLPASRRHDVAAYLDAHPDAADRVAAYVQQRDALALLGRCLAPEPSPARLAGLEAALLGAMRRQGRARRAIAATGAAALAAVGGWPGRVG